MAEAIGPGGAEMGQSSSRVAAPSTGSKSTVTEALTTEGTWTPTFGVHGLDVSGHQPSVNWQQQWDMGARFAYVKASEGNYYTNEVFGSQYQGSRSVGMIRGAYHFAIPNWSSGADQARYFVQNGGGWSADGYTLPPVLDFEFNPYAGRTISGFYFGNTCYDMSPGQLATWVRDFGNTMMSLTGRLPVIYTNTSWWNQCLGNPAGFGDYPLWVAAYPSSFTNNAGPVPSASWSTYSIWQYSSTGPFAGDSNVWNGSYTDLQRFARANLLPADHYIRTPADVLALDNSGTLWNYGNTGTGIITSKRAIGFGLTDLVALFAVDWNLDGVLDLLTQKRDGRLLLYFGSPSGGFGSGNQIGVGWTNLKIATANIGPTGSYPSILAVDDRGQIWRYSNSSGTGIDDVRTPLGAIALDAPFVIADFNADGIPDILTRYADGNLYVAEAGPAGKYVVRPVPVGTGWDASTALFASRGLGGAGTAGIISRMNNGNLVYYSIRSTGGWGPSSIIGVGFNGFVMGGSTDFTPPLRPSIVRAADVVAADSAGLLWNFRVMTGGQLSSRVQIGNGFQDAESLAKADWNGDGVLDLLVQWKSGQLAVYLGSSTGGFSNPRIVGSAGWQGLKLTVGSWTQSGYPDVLAIDNQGTLRLYRNAGDSGMLQGGGVIGSGWGQMRTTMLGWNSDRANDLLAVDSAGEMYAYLGNGIGGFAPAQPAVVGTGWSSMNTVTASIDFLADRQPGVLARNHSGALAHYSIAPGGSFSGRQDIAGSWNGYMIAATAAPAA